MTLILQLRKQDTGGEQARIQSSKSTGSRIHALSQCIHCPLASTMTAGAADEGPWPFIICLNLQDREIHRVVVKRTPLGPSGACLYLTWPWTALVLLPARFSLLNSEMQQTEPEGSLNHILITLFFVTPVLSASRVTGIVVLGELLRWQRLPDSCKTQLKVQAFI